MGIKHFKVSAMMRMLICIALIMAVARLVVAGLGEPPALTDILANVRGLFVTYV